MQTGVVIGDLKAGSLTVAAGARMRGQAEFGWDDGKGPKAGKRSNGAEARRQLMSTVRPGSPGATRECPHCRETILESAGVCPACRHYLRYDARRRSAAAPALTPLRIEGSIRHPADGEPWEYTVVVSIRNDRGEEIARKLIGVGAMNPNEQRTFTLSVEAVPTKGKLPEKAARGTEGTETSCSRNRRKRRCHAGHGYVVRDVRPRSGVIIQAPTPRSAP